MSAAAKPEARAVAVAGSNIALVKYWGKRAGVDPGLNLPAVGSLSLTLEALTTCTEVRFDEALASDRLTLDGRPEEGAALARVSRFLDRVRALARLRARAEVRSRNDFPTAAGLASSASGFAALALAATTAAGLRLDGKVLSQLARQGSGSAARSIFGGLVLLHRGERDDGADCFAEPLPSTLKLRMVVGVAGARPKATPSTDGMARTAATSPYYPAWLSSQPADLAAAQQAVGRGDLEALGEIAERSCLAMHASALAARPGILYWTGTTVDGFHAIRALRREGVGVWFTNDAGPQIKALCGPDSVARVAAALAEVAGVERTLVSACGAGARLVEEGPQ